MFKSGNWHFCFSYESFLASTELFKDEETAKLILQAKSPKDQKALGRKVRNFVEETWTAQCRDIVKAGNRAKVCVVMMCRAAHIEVCEDWRQSKDH